MPPRGRPRYTEAQKAEAKRKRAALQKCDGCNEDLKRTAWYEHQRRGCGAQVPTVASGSNLAAPRQTDGTTNRAAAFAAKRIRGSSGSPHEPIPGSKRSRLNSVDVLPRGDLDLTITAHEQAKTLATADSSTSDLTSEPREDNGRFPSAVAEDPAMGEQNPSGPSRQPSLGRTSDARDSDDAPTSPVMDPGSLSDLDGEETRDTGDATDEHPVESRPGFGNRLAASDEGNLEDPLVLPAQLPNGLDDPATGSATNPATYPATNPATDPATNAGADDEPVIHLDELLSTQKFIEALRSASLDDIKGTIPREVFDRLQHPSQEELRINDPVLRFSLEMYLLNTTESVYTHICESLGRVHSIEMLSYAAIKNKAREISGIYPIYSDMCVNSCMAYTGHLAALTICPTCGEHRYDQQILRTKAKEVARQQFVSNPIGPQIQAAYASRTSAEDMSYRARCTQSILEEIRATGMQPSEFSDYTHGTEYLEAVQAGDITDESTVLMLSLDGAQLYQSKASDCWMYIWVFLNRSPDTRYKKQNVVIGGVIPGPNKPGNMDSFLFPALQHLAALMTDGLVVWDAATGRVFTTPIFLAFITADGPGMTELNGLVGHSGRYGCRLYCAMKGRRKPEVGIYYPVSLKPTNYSVDGCTHDDVDLRTVSSRSAQREATNRYEENLRRLVGSRNQTQYRLNRLETGIAKQALISGLPEECMFFLPGCGPGDLMHLAGLNIPDLLMTVWRGLMSCDTRLGDNKDLWDWAVFRDTAVWSAHGKQVAAATPYLPGSFDRPPRNPAEKISSGYKAVEFLTYLYGLGPALFYGVLPMKYWRNFCKLVRGIRLVHQRHITREQIAEAHRLLLEFCQEWEELYCQRMPARLHFVRQSIHALCHIGPETTRIGPYAGVTQWTMERAIGDLGSEIRQPSKPFANLAQRSTRRCVSIALTAMVPELVPPTKLPRGAIEAGKSYVLMCKSEEYPTAVAIEERSLLTAFMKAAGANLGQKWLKLPTVARWARLRLPNSQIARSWWKEESQQAHGLNHIRMARNVKIRRNGKTEFAEVRYYFTLETTGETHQRRGRRAYAMVDIYGPPDTNLLTESSNTLWSCRRQADHHGLEIIDVTSIESVVAMIPHPSPIEGTIGPSESSSSYTDRVYVVEKMGLDVATMSGISVEDPHLDNE